MSARSQHRTEGPAEGLNLARSFRNCLASGVVVINSRERILSATPEIERLLHLAHDKTAGAPLALLPDSLQKVVREVIGSKTTVIRDRLTLTLAGKNPRDFHVTAQPIQHDAESLEVVLVLSDVTSFTQLEHRITHLDRLAMLGSLSADMAHEIKNALVAVKTFVDLLLEKHRDEELAGMVGREMRRLDTIMDQRLRFSGKERSTHGPVRLHDVLEHSLRMVQHQLAGKFISLNRSFNAAPDAVHGDDHQLQQVFVNLLLNAVEASTPNGSLTVATELVAPASPRPGQPHVRITVADTGMGIAPENLDRMFEPFFTTKHDGTGLGLPITRRIVHEHHGHITVQSEPNKGTTFSILLPAGDHAR
jgi:signal transduction histidine kinase